MKITDKQIADITGRSPQVISAMKKSYPSQYEVLKVGAYAILHNLISSKSFSEMTIDELLEEQKHALNIGRHALDNIEKLQKIILLTFSR